MHKWTPLLFFSALTFGAMAQAQETTSAPVAAVNTQNDDQVRSYWTKERMQNAKPMEKHVDGVSPTSSTGVPQNSVPEGAPGAPPQDDNH